MTRAALRASLAESTFARYEREWRRFRAAVPTPNDFVGTLEYLASLSHGNARVARAAIAFFSNSELSHPLVSRVISGLWKTASHPVAHDLEHRHIVALRLHVCAWGVTERLSNDRLLARALVCFRLATWARSSDCARIPRSLIKEIHNGLCVTILDPKQRRPSAPHAKISFVRAGDSRLCPVRHVQEVIRRFPNSAQLFPMDTDEIMSRVDGVLKACSETRLLTPHDLRHLGASSALSLGFNVDQVARHGCWASATTLLRFYAEGWPRRPDSVRPTHISLSAFV